MRSSSTKPRRVHGVGRRKLKGQAFCLLDGLSGVFLPSQFNGGLWQNSDWSGMQQMSGGLGFSENQLRFIVPGFDHLRMD
jgi:hypothetical protein